MGLILFKVFPFVLLLFSKEMQFQTDVEGFLPSVGEGFSGPVVRSQEDDMKLPLTIQNYSFSVNAKSARAGPTDCGGKALGAAGRGGQEGSCPGGLTARPPPPPPGVPAVWAELSGNAVFLRCSFQDRSANGSVGFTVSWHRRSPRDGQPREELRTETSLHASSSIELDGLNLRLGDTIYCSSSSFFLDSPDVLGPTVESQEFFAGIRLRPAVSSVPEDGRDYGLSVESTVPLPCAPQPGPCGLVLQLSAQTQEANEVLGPDLVLSSCLVELGAQGGPCRSGVCSRALVTFTPITDFVRDAGRSTQISVRPIDSKHSFLWNGYTPEPVQVTVEDEPPAYCYVATDPHVITFDGSLYDNDQIGTFLLYRSLRRPLEVHVRQWECGSVVQAASCVCGVVARDGGDGGGDVIALDMCDGEMGETQPRLTVKNRHLGRSGVRITQSYQGRKVTL
ncbi:unnamed protein product [Boreogadus saida]